MPLDIPVTIPVEPTATMPPAPADQMPPLVVELSEVLAPTHTERVPVMAAGDARTVINAVSKQPLPVI